MAKIAELLQSPQRHRRVTVQNQEMTVGKEMFLDIDGKQVEMEMTECQLAVSSNRSDAATDCLTSVSMHPKGPTCTLSKELINKVVNKTNQEKGST